MVDLLSYQAKEKAFMSSIQTTSLIKTNKNFIVGYFQSKYHSNVWSFMNNRTQVLKRSIHGAAHIRVVPGNAKEELKKGIKVDQYYYITASTIKYGNQGWHLSLRQDLLDCISLSDVPAENYHFLVLLDKMALDITYSDLKKMNHKCMYNQLNQICLLYELDESKYFPKSMYKPTFTNVKYDSAFAYYEPNFKPECIGNVKYAKKYVKGLYCIDLYDENNNLIKEGVIKGVNMVDLWNGLKKAAGDSTQLDCSSATSFQNKFRKGRDVKLTNKGSKDVLLARIRQLEKRVETLEGEVKELKEFRDEAVRELKEVKAKVEEFDSLTQLDVATSLQSFKVLLYKHCAGGKNKLTKDIVEKEGYSDVFNYLLSKGAITRVPSDNYYFIHWNLLKAA